MTKNIKFEIYCQKGKSIYTEIPLNSEEYEKDGIRIQATEETVKGCRLGKLFLDIKNASITQNFKSGQTVFPYGAAAEDDSNVPL